MLKKRGFRGWISILYGSVCVSRSLNQRFTFVMSSFFEGWSAHDIIGPLNRKEVRAVLVGLEVGRVSFRTWNDIGKTILNSDDDVKVALFETGIAKWNVEEEHRLIGLKRRREAKAMSRNVRRHIGDSFFVFFFFWK